MTNKGNGKGKQPAGKSSAGKRKGNFDDDKTGGAGKRKNRGVVQFFDEAADVDEYESDNDTEDSDFDDLFGDECETLSTMLNDTAKGQSRVPFTPKEELVDEEEFDRLMEERYAGGSKFIHFADEYDDKPMDPSSMHPGAKELTPTIFKVKCTVGRERLSAFCLMQKFADMKSLGTNLKLISAFAVDHMKGFVFMEADKQCDINEACKGLTGIYVTRVQPVPPNEVYHLFSVRKRSADISEGMWARIKSGNYKGDLAQVAAVNKKITVKLIPRVDLQALAAKFGGGYSRQKTGIAAPRLICSSDLDEFRPLIQLRQDRDTGKVFQVLDGMMLKDGFIYKKVSPDSLSLWGVVPTEEELLKFGPSENNESTDLEWLSQLYGDAKKKRAVRGADKGGGKGEGPSSSGVVNGFELYDLVCFGKKDFGVIVSMDKEDNYKILKESSDGPVAVTLERNQIKSGLFDLKLTAQDRHSKTILVNDNVRVLEGPSKDKQGIVKHIYRGIVFLYNEIEEENGGYFTAKSSVCEKVKHVVGDCIGKDGEPGPFNFEDPLEDQPTSPRSPLSPKKPWQARENNHEFSRGDQDSMFTIGQTLRIRIGPLKGYLCRVIALRRSDVTVKLDSQQKVLTVKSEHLSEVQGKSTAVSASADPDSSSLKPFDLLGTEGSSGGWMDGVGASTGGGGWNVGGTSAGESAGAGGWNVGGTSAGESTGGGGWNVGGTSAGESTGGGGWNAGGTSAGESTGGGVWNAGGASAGESTGGGAWNAGGASAGESTGGGAWNAGGASAGESTGGGAWNAGGSSAGESTGGGGWNAGGTSAKRSAWPDPSASNLKPESTANPFSSEGTEDTAWAAKSTSNQKSSWGAAVENNGTTSHPDHSGGCGKGGGNWGQVENKSVSMDVDNQNCTWKNNTSNLDGNQSSGWNTTKAAEEESPGWNSVKKSNDSPATAWGQGTGFKSGSDDGGNLNSAGGDWKSGTSGVKEVGNEPSGWGGNGGGSWGQAGHKSGSMDADNQNSTWKNKTNDLGGNQSSGWNATKASEDASPGWNGAKKSNDSSATGWGQGNGFKSGSGDGGGWKSGTSDADDGAGGGNWRSGRGGGGSERGGRGDRGGFGGRGGGRGGGGGGACYKCGEEGHMARDCSKGGGGGGGGGACYKCGEEGHMARDCSKGGGGGGGSGTCYKCGEEGHMARDCSKGGGGGGGGGACYKCGEEGHMARDCSKGGGGGGGRGACYKCGEEGHMARDCSKGGGGGGGRSACYKCGEEGHMARDCSKGGGGGGGGSACYKCGEEGHMARDCSKGGGGGGGGGACYKCGEEGHMARDCSKGGGGGGGRGACYKCGEEGHLARDCGSGSGSGGGGGGWNGGGSSGGSWGKKNDGSNKGGW